MAEFFQSLSHLRQSQPISAEVVRRAAEHCRGGTLVRNLDELYAWMLDQNPETPFFLASIATGKYPTSLAAFVTSCSWEDWKKHAVYAMHGEIYLQRLEAVKSVTPGDIYRDHMAGASMHRANGYAHMARAARAQGLAEISLPCWPEPRELTRLSAQAVADLRLSCTLRSDKYGQKQSSENTVKAYQAALRNLADAMQIHASLSGDGADEVGRKAVWLRERATNLALTNQRLLVACAAGEDLSTAEERQVNRDLRLAETAASEVTRQPAPPDPESEADGELEACARCGASPVTHLGYTCRCLCLCEGCARTTRVQECPICNDFTEFVRR